MTWHEINDYIPSIMLRKLEHEIRDVYPDSLTWQKTIPTFHPETAEEASDIFRRAAKYDQKIFIAGFGNNIDPAGDEFADLLVLKTDRLNTILEIAAADFHIAVGSGYPLIQINQAIADHNLWFPFGDTSYPGSAGGALAAGLTGRDAVHETPLSKYLLSVKAVLPDGSLVKPGAKTFKSVSGYDISRIFFNSWGTLGLVVELDFRVLPLSRKEQSPHLALTPPNYESFVRDLQGDSSLAVICRKIKDEYDPNRLLPLI